MLRTVPLSGAPLQPLAFTHRSPCTTHLGSCLPFPFVPPGTTPGRQRGGALSAQAAGGDGGRQAWDFGRFLRTVLYFNEPPKLDDVLSRVQAALQGPSSAPQSRSAEQPQGGYILVVGATGGVGRRVVGELRRQNIPVKAMVRDLAKGEQLLGPQGPGLQFVRADLADGASLRSGLFRGVRAVVNAAAAIVGPKEGDTPDRQKYSQGIKFFDPEVKEHSPEVVEFRGVQQLVAAVLPHVGTVEGRSLFSVAPNGLPVGPAWGALDDVVMGGVSESGFQIDRTGGENGGPVGLFKGTVSVDNSGGFASIRTKNFTPPEDLQVFEGLAIRLKGTGKRYKLIIRTTTNWDSVGYTASFDTNEGVWQTVRLPWSAFVPVFRAKTVKDREPLDPSNVVSLQLMYSKFEYDGSLNPSFEPGPFELRVSQITAYPKQRLSPRFVHVGSAGVTRPGRPGLDLEKQPPAVRMNDQLGGLLTYKLKGEDVIRASGIPYCIVRPVALTEEPAGADLEFDQGDNITGKIGREEVARIVVAALSSPDATDKTFEVKSKVPFNTPFTVNAENPPPPRDYTPYFKQLKPGLARGKREEKAAVRA